MASNIYGQIVLQCAFSTKLTDVFTPVAIPNHPTKAFYQGDQLGYPDPPFYMATVVSIRSHVNVVKVKTSTPQPPKNRESLLHRQISGVWKLLSLILQPINEPLQHTSSSSISQFYLVSSTSGFPGVGGTSNIFHLLLNYIMMFLFY